MKQLVRFYGHRKLSDLKRWDAEYYKIEMSSLFAPASVNRLLGNLKHIMSTAVLWNILPENPFGGVKLLRVPKRTERILAKEEEERLLAACGQVHTPLLRTGVVIALNTGMGKGEIHGLRWEHVDLPNRLILVWNGKTNESDRCIPMNQVVYELLSNFFSKSVTASLYCPALGKRMNAFETLKPDS